MSVGICKHCKSKNTKVSAAYPTDYFCLDCKDGDKLVNILQKEDKRSSAVHASGIVLSPDAHVIPCSIPVSFSNLCCEIDLDGKPIKNNSLPDQKLEFED